MRTAAAVSHVRRSWFLGVMAKLPPVEIGKMDNPTVARCHAIHAPGKIELQDLGRTRGHPAC